MRIPARVLVVDAAVLVAFIAGRGFGAVYTIAQSRALFTTDRAIAETRRRVELGMRRPELLPDLAALTEAIEVRDALGAVDVVHEAERALKLAVASRNGSTDDVHILALAWALDADIWSTDRDFAGSGVASWSTANLLRALKQSQRG